jgi:hypothetical protein
MAMGYLWGDGEKMAVAQKDSKAAVPVARSRREAQNRELSEAG